MNFDNDNKFCRVGVRYKQRKGCSFMTQNDAITILQEGILTVIMLSLPMLGTSLLVGIVISVIQATTQINDQMLSFVPKIIAIFLVIILFGPWIINKSIDFVNKLFDYINLI